MYTYMCVYVCGVEYVWGCVFVTTIKEKEDYEFERELKFTCSF